MSLHPRRHRWRTQWATVVWLTVVWVFLWGDLSVGNVLSGLLIALAVTTGLRMAPIDFHGRFRPLGFLRLFGRFAVDLVKASFEVSLIAIRPRYVPHGAVIGVQLRSHSDLYLTLTAELSSLVPGSLVVEAHRLTGMLYLHVLDVRQSGGIEAARAGGAGPGGAGAAGVRVGRGAGRGRAGGARMTVVVWVCGVLLTVGAVLAVIRAEKGPSMLDRTIALDIVVTTMIAAVALYAAVERRTDVVPILVVLSLVGFVGSVTIARFAAVEPEGEGRVRTREEIAAQEAERMDAEDEAEGTRRDGPTRGVRRAPRRRRRGGGPRMTQDQWTTVADVASAVCLLGGAFLAFAAGVGVLRFPDLLARMHAGTKPQVLGLALVLIGLALRLRSGGAVWALVLVAVFQMLTAPVAAHMVGRAGYRTGKVRSDLLVVDELTSDQERAQVRDQGRPDDDEPPRLRVRRRTR